MPTQAAPNLDDLLRVLHAATDKKTLHWKTTAEEDTFRTDFGAGIVRLSREEAGSRYRLSLLDGAGTLLDEFQPSGEGEVIQLEALYKKARRQALDLDLRLRSVFEQLKTLAGES